MTQLSFTVSDVLQTIADLRGESQVDTNLNRIRMVSNAYQDYARRRPWRSHLLRDQVLTGDGTNDYTIGSTTFPMRTKGLTEVFVGQTIEGNRYQIVDFNRFKEIYNGNNGAKMAYEWYDASNDVWKLHINPAPSASDTITYSYYWTPKALNSESDRIVCFNSDIIAHGALATLYHSEDELQKEALSRQEVENLINEAIGAENAPGVNQLYMMGAIENSGGNRGIGTY